MRKQSVAPVDSPRQFGIHELFFSTTDARGVIEAGNDVFVRISDYPIEDLVGSPHNLIRHPDMPRAVFRLLWAYLHAGRAIAAYVKNLARDGRYYWVVALVIPIGERYLSIRFRPTSPLHETVAGLYAEMLRLEAAAPDGPADMDAATDHLVGALATLGFDGYDGFMRTMLREEMKSRDAHLAGEGGDVLLPLPPAHAGAAEDAIRAIHTGCSAAHQQLSRLFARLDGYVALNEQLTRKSNSVLQLTQAFRFISLNTAVKSARLGQQGAGLGVIAGYLGGSSADVSKLVGSLTDRIGATSERLAAVIFDLAGARLETEMILVFCRELILGLHAGDASDDQAAAGRQQAMIADLAAAFRHTIDNTIETLRSFGKELGGLSGTSADLQKIMLTLEFTQLGGMVEAYRLDQEAIFGVIFTEVRQQLDETKSELVGLTDITEKLTVLMVEAPQVAAALASAETSMEEQVALL